jgi:uncharacterized protein involved in outer membrane biogenesis
MKKIIIIAGSLITLLLLAAIIIPFVYEDDIQKLIKKSLDENIEANVYFDPSEFGLTLFRSFPNPTATIGDFGIVGIDKFEGDTLISVNTFDITIDLFSLFGSHYRIKSVNLDNPRINVILLKDGDANYEIAVETEESGKTSEEQASDFNLAIDHWSINDGFLSYQDETTNTQVLIEGLNHQGNGNISLDIYDLRTVTNIRSAKINYDGINYLNGQSLNADLTLNINLPEFKFTFKDNEIKINDFPFTFSGYVAMPEEAIDMDISFSSINADIRSLYSLVPGVFTEGYENINAEGELSFNGFLKGKYDEASMPAYQVQLKAANGRISYPDLPTPIENINIDLLVDCQDGIIDHTSVNISQFQMDLGNNPIEGNLLLRNLTDYSMKANINAELDLAELNSIFPMEGLDMRGLFNLHILADGKYDSTKNLIPALNVSMNLENGYIKSSEFPRAIEHVSFHSSIDGSTGQMEDVIINVPDFKLEMEGDQLTGNLALKNLVDYEWELSARGGLDLEVISEVYPIEGMSYTGKLKADIQTAGKYSDVEAERYDRFPTSGVIELTDFTFKSSDLPQGMRISRSKVSLDPKLLNIDSFEGAIGESDLKVNGFIGNYIDYVFAENAPLTGKMKLDSKLINLNEFMSDEETIEKATEQEDTLTMQAVQIPRNIDFEFNSSIDRILYDNLVLENANGLLAVRDGVLDMSDLSFGLLGGTVVMNGQYDTRVADNPAFEYELNIQQLSIPDAYTSFSTVKTFAPMAQLMNGTFSTNFSLRGKLKEDMTPVYESLNGNGLIQIAEAFMKESTLVSGIAGFMKSDMGSSQLSLKDVIMKASLENGRAYVSPFDVEMAGHKANIGGSIGADGSLDYKLNTEVDAGFVGQQVNQLLATLRGNQNAETSSKIQLHFNVTGTYDKPKINLMGTTSEDGSSATVQDQVKQEVKAEVEHRVDSVKQEAEARFEEETDRLMEEGEKQVQQQLDTLKKEITKDLEGEMGEILGDEIDSTANELKNTLKNLFKKKKKKEN